MIADIVGNSEAVIQTNDLELFKRLLKFVSVTSSMLVSQSVIGNASDAADIVRRAMQDAGMPAESPAAAAAPAAAGGDSDWDDGGW